MKDNTSTPAWITAEWPAPDNIRAGSTTRRGGISAGPYHSFNLASHVGDNRNNVAENRRRLRSDLQLPAEPFWLQQIHSNRIIMCEKEPAYRQADGSYTNLAGRVCVVLTADCLPVLLCDRLGTEIAAVHVGWRGFSRNIIKNTLACFTNPPENLMAWLGPCISPTHYEIDRHVRDACLRIAPESVNSFVCSRPEHWFADLKRLVQQQLAIMGTTQIYQCCYCTYNDEPLFYSYRREPVCGRIATMIWMDS